MIHMGVGQCGCQVESAIWQYSARDPLASDDFNCFDLSGHAGVVLVDSEPKVVRKISSHLAVSRFERGELRPALIGPGDVVVDERGRGASWALGFADKPEKRRIELSADIREGLRLLDGDESEGGGMGRVLEAMKGEEGLKVRVGRGELGLDGCGLSRLRLEEGGGVEREVLGWRSTLEEDEGLSLSRRALGALRRKLERMDAVDGVVVCFGCGGGTGSGVGSRMLDGIRESFPGLSLIAAPVLPSAYGGSPLQSVNATLSLRDCLELSDVVVAHHNDVIQELAKDTGSIADWNDIIAQNLNALFHPRIDTEGFKHRFRPSEFQGATCPRPRLNLVFPSTAPIVFRSKIKHKPTALSSPSAPPADIVWAKRFGLPLPRPAPLLAVSPEDAFSIRKSVVLHRKTPLPPASTSHHLDTPWTDLSRSLSAISRTTQSIFSTLPDSPTSIRPSHPSASLLIARGPDIPPTPKNTLPSSTADWGRTTEILHKLQSPATNTSWTSIAPSIPPLQVERSLSIVQNHPTLAIPLLTHLANTTTRKIAANAYIHVLERQGCPKEELIFAAATLKEISKSYS